ncbi:MAG: 5-methyltetrahydropteroyltriglutamate--homocysteine S-methyltransferase [Candidatus Auribacterota bacterium]
MKISTSAFGFPKIGPNRELKKAIENFWKGNDKEELFSEAEAVDLQRIEEYKNAGIDNIPSNDFSLYDAMLDLSTMFNIIPDRFAGITDPLEQYFAMARGTKDAPACEMTKWFDTNYHYIVPELKGDLHIIKNRPLYSYNFVEKKAGIQTRPVIIGPFTFIALSKLIQKDDQGNPQTIKAIESPLFPKMAAQAASVYNQILKELENRGVEWVQLDEPAAALDLTNEQETALLDAYIIATERLSSLKIQVQTYYEAISGYKRVVERLPVAAIGLDFTCNDENLNNIRKHGFPSNKILVAGVVSGRAPWKTDIRQAVNLVKELASIVGEERLVISNAAPLSHLPYSLDPEHGHLNPNVIKLLSFAKERLAELTQIKNIINNNAPIPDQNLQAIRDLFKNDEVRQKLAMLDLDDAQREPSFKERYETQMKLYGLPLFPTTTIGSFPQTKEVRKARADFRAGRITADEYNSFIQDSIKEVVKLQEDIGIDVLVHGEFERTDMVEFFGEKMEGFAFTKNGWVQSYGTRCVRPPIIYGDVSRPEKMTVDEVVYAQSLTNRIMKGMLTGPITITNWSFYRRDIPKSEVVYQIALALNDEVLDLEEAGIKIIQIDEPAFREAVPLKKAKQADYFKWAVTAFKLSNIGVQPETQIHTHMCYSEFNEIIEHILAMDSDVISMEASRSKGDLIEAFEKFNYDHGIGVGVYDIHSPRIPTVDEMEEIAERTIRVIDKSLFWINPDCGLKTRGYEETLPALKNMVEVARRLRKKYALVSK